MERAFGPPCRPEVDHAWVEQTETADSNWNVVLGDRRWQCELCGARQVTQSRGFAGHVFGQEGFTGQIARGTLLRKP